MVGSKLTLVNALAPTQKQPPHTVLERLMRVPESARCIQWLNSTRLDQ